MLAPIAQNRITLLQMISFQIKFQICMGFQWRLLIIEIFLHFWIVQLNLKIYNVIAAVKTLKPKEKCDLSSTEGQ